MNKKASQKRRTDVVELVKESLLNGPVSLELYAQIVKCDSDDPASWERSARRLVKKLRGQGHEVVTSGDGDRLTLDFSKAQRLTGRLKECASPPSATVVPKGAQKAPGVPMRAQASLITIKEAAALMACSPKTLERKLRSKRAPFPVVRPKGWKGYIRVKRDDVLAWIETNTVRA